MLIKYALTALAILVLAGTATAEPTGSYNVVGRNPDTDENYTGTVEVSRHGETYVVVWNIGGKESIGTGIGARFAGDRFEMGPASDDDTAISVGYVAEDNFGIAMYFEQSDGSWQGVWSYGGSEKVTGEIWTRQ
ncbi:MULTISPECIES: hypothetical protein [Alphaproteobacteria]|nr:MULTISPECIES: hypothetical protein [Alphaproteobacteria]GLR22989.1 hypothetical protein GCM10007920_27770 [Ciceribacter naphthalenivorans]GLT05845.1 hypothetical protein GCM10007926_27770 [Sphingomonas psychrolutea]